MHHIIVPVDLSPNSKVALRYTAHLAAAAKVGITIVFAYNLLEKAIRYTTKKGQVDKDPDKWIQKRIDKIHAKRPEIEIEYRIIKGDIIDSIQRLINITEADLVIMGCQGKDETTETYLGSTAIQMIKTSNVPILLIPPKYKFRGLQRIAFAAKNSSISSEKILDPLNALKGIFQFHIDHIDIEKDTHCLQDNLLQQDNDLLIIHRHENRFLENIVDLPQAPIEIFKINIPLLVLVGQDS